MLYPWQLYDGWLFWTTSGKNILRNKVEQSDTQSHLKCLNELAIGFAVGFHSIVLSLPYHLVSHGLKLGSVGRVIIVHLLIYLSMVVQCVWMYLWRYAILYSHWLFSGSIFKPVTQFLGCSESDAIMGLLLKSLLSDSSWWANCPP